MSTPNWEFEEGDVKVLFPHGVEVDSWMLFRFPDRGGNFVFEDRLEEIGISGKRVKFFREGWVDVDRIVLLEARTRARGGAL